MVEDTLHLHRKYFDAGNAVYVTMRKTRGNGDGGPGNIDVGVVVNK